MQNCKEAHDGKDNNLPHKPVYDPSRVFVLPFGQVDVEQH